MPSNLLHVRRRGVEPGRQPSGRRVGRSLRASFVVVLLLPLSLAGCDLVSLPGWSRAFSEHRLYTYDFFASFGECLEAQPSPDFWINCSQTANFCPNGRVELMVTDILHAGTCAVDGRSVTLTFRENPEVGRRVRFVLSPDGESITERGSGSVWKRKGGEQLEEARRFCFPLE